jgi:hypothetical protein
MTTLLWVAITALAMVAAWNCGAILRLQRRIEQLTWLNIANPPTEQRKTRWPPSTGWNGLDNGRQERKP